MWKAWSENVAFEVCINIQMLLRPTRGSIENMCHLLKDRKISRSTNIIICRESFTFNSNLIKYKRRRTTTVLIMNSEKEKHCIICGCSKHKLIGCFTHWIHHMKNKEGRCETRDF